LLEEIRKEKAKLIKEGKIKKEKPLPEITEKDIPFDIPDTWCWCRLGDIVKNVNYGTSAKSHATGKIPVLRMGNITKDGKLSFDSLVYTSDDTEIETYKLNIGDILFNRTNSAEWVGKTTVYKGEQPAIFAGYLIRYTPIFIDSDYVNAVMNTAYQKKWCSEVKTNGVQQCNINAQNLMKFVFPLPPLSEQKRIVVAIEKFMPLIEEYGKKETELKAFNEQIGTLTKKAILQEAVQGKLVPQIAAEGNAKDLLEEIKKEKAKLIKEGKIKKEKALPEITEDEIPFDIPESWCWCRLGELVDTNIGLTYSPSDIITSGGTEVLRSNNIQNGKIVYDDLVHVSKNVPEKCLSKKGDLLICARNGSKALVGKSALIEQDGMAFGAFMAIVRSPINPYILHFINSPVYRAKLDGVNTTTINQITQDNLRETLFPLPPLAEQKRIVEAIEKMLPLCEKLGE